MSTTPPPDRPTERLQPTPPPQYERVVPAGADPNLLFVRLEDTISSLRTALVIVGVLAVAALGLGLYAVLSNDNSTGTTRGAASADRVARLDDRVDRLSRQVQQLRSSTNALTRRVDDLSRQLATLRSESAGGPASSDTTQALQDLNKRVDDLSRQVQQLGQTQTTP